jgi:hypothetical protein
MELRKLSTYAERDCFGRQLREVRAMRGSGFTETARSLTGQVHLRFGNLYGLFDELRAPFTMLGGFAMHDLAMFGQSFPRPDLSHLPPDKVFECGELWAVAAGVAPILRRAGFILAGLFDAAALLVYPLFKPWNLSSAYKKGFERMGDPVEWPYIHTLAGEKMWVQPMVSQNEDLWNIIGEAGVDGFEILQDGKQLRFNTPHCVSARTVYERAVPRDQAAAVGRIPSHAAA